MVLDDESDDDDHDGDVDNNKIDEDTIEDDETDEIDYDLDSHNSYLSRKYSCRHHHFPHNLEVVYKHGRVFPL